MITRHSRSLEQQIGQHLLIECNGVSFDLLNQPEFLQQMLTDASVIAGSTILKTAFHHFEPHGVTGVLVVSESHFAIHTWPEFGYAAIDIFSCAEHVPVEELQNFFTERLKAELCTVDVMVRGKTMRQS